MLPEGPQGHSETTEEPWIGTMTPGSQPSINLSSSVPCPSVLRQSSAPVVQHVLPCVTLTLCHVLPGSVSSHPFALPGTEVVSVQAMHTGGSSGHITYSIISGNERNAFLIQPSSGTVPGAPGELCSCLLRCSGPPGHRSTVHTVYQLGERCWYWNVGTALSLARGC